MTRAMERLTLTNATMRRMHGSVRYNAPSRFLAEIPEELLSGRRLRPTRPSEPTFEPGPRVDFSDAQWAADDLPVIREGMSVEHPIFGVGASPRSLARESRLLTIRFDRARAAISRHAQPGPRVIEPAPTEPPQASTSRPAPRRPGPLHQAIDTDQLSLSPMGAPVTRRDTPPGTRAPRGRGARRSSS
jgi:hypothetical protein